MWKKNQNKQTNKQTKESKTAMAATQYLCTYKPDEKVKEQKINTTFSPPMKKTNNPNQTNKQNVAIFGKMKFSNADTYIP